MPKPIIDRAARAAAPEVARDGDRREWIAPVLRRISANEARNGIDPIIPDGPLSFGS